MATKATNGAEVTENREESGDGPLMDGMAQAVKKMIARGKERGYVTYDEMNAALPPDQSSSEQIEDTMAMLSEMGINVVESEEQDDNQNAAAESDGETRVSGNLDDDDIGRTDDPVRMYLREMGSVELLSREGEIAIAKRIEAGRDMMIMGLCESPITFHAIIHWSEALNAEEMQLREILDLDAMLSKEPPVEKMEEGAEDDDEEPEISEATAGPTYKEEEEVEEEEDDSDEDDDG